MIFERISDLEIKVTLEEEDLNERQLIVSDLKYGSDTTKELLQEVMDAAEDQLDFRIEGHPLMVEAIPYGEERLVLLITKITEADELDTRFAKFSPLSTEEAEDMDEDDKDADEDNDNEEDAGSGLMISPAEFEELLNLLPTIKSAEESPETSEEEPAEANADTPKETRPQRMVKRTPKAGPSTRIFLFHSLETVITLSGQIADYYQGQNWLYKDEEHKVYYLVLKKDAEDSEGFNRACSCILEYTDSADQMTEAYLQEHLQLIHGVNAIQVLKDY